MTQEDDFRRDRDPRARRNARLAGAAAACLAATVIAVSVARSGDRSQTAAQASPNGAPPQSLRSSLPLAPLSLTPTPIPAQPVLGSSFSAAYDPRAHQLVTFGGIDSYDTTWTWDGRRWTLARPPIIPPGRFAAAAAYDPATGVVMMYGGRLAPGEVVNDTWSWDGATWLQLDGGTGNPPQGEGSVMAWDDAAKLMILVNTDPSSAGGTWTWNGSRWLHQPRGSLPTGTGVIGMAPDPVTRTLLAVVCCGPNDGTTSTLRWDGATWRTVPTHTAPGFGVGMVRDPASNRLLLLGDPSIDAGRDLWSWDGRDWVLLTAAQLPNFPAAAVADTNAGHVVIVGSILEPVQGHPQPVHVWTLNGLSWRQLG
jgi:hypothetical protein